MEAPSFPVHHLTKNLLTNKKKKQPQWFTQAQSQQKVLNLAAQETELDNMGGPPLSRRTYCEGVPLAIVMAVPSCNTQQLFSFSTPASCSQIKPSFAVIPGVFAPQNFQEFVKHRSQAAQHTILPGTCPAHYLIISPSVTFSKFRLPQKWDLVGWQKPKHTHTHTQMWTF